jgi:hypothetical protein
MEAWLYWCGYSAARDGVVGERERDVPLSLSYGWD